VKIDHFAAVGSIKEVSLPKFSQDLKIFESTSKPLNKGIPTNEISTLFNETFLSDTL